MNLVKNDKSFTCQSVNLYKSGRLLLLEKKLLWVFFVYASYYFHLGVQAPNPIESFCLCGNWG